MTDIVDVTTDIKVLDTQTNRAANILSVQIGALEYAQDLGIDLKYFLSEDFKFQNESFRSYLIQVLANYGINVAIVDEEVQNLFTKLKIGISPSSNDGTLVAR